MEILLQHRSFVCLLLTLALLSGCDRVPDYDSKEAQDLMRTTVYTLVKNALRETGTSDDGQAQKPLALQISDRHQAMIDMYHPHVAIAVDGKWLRSRLETGAPDLFKGENFTAYLMLKNYGVIREAVSVSLAQHEPLPDRVEDKRTYKKVCRAKLTIAPNGQSSKKFESINLTYSVNPPPRSGRTSAASPFYVAVNFFEATEPPLPFSLSESEKVALMALGAVKDIRAVPRPQSPETRVIKIALRAFRAYMESEEATATEAPPNPSIERTPPGKPVSASHVKR
ncbi:hypothetical protein [Pseudorhodoferax sp.]|uniref:hypothetical protein n=1 Tax=Pseudorhodoferax sp. TaxID=1993553 RepID=UPI0039E4F501